MGDEQEKRQRPPYASMADLEALFERMGRMGDPGTIDKAWVESYKLAAAQPQAIVSVLRWLGVIDKDGKSLNVWNELRVPATQKTKLDKLLRAAYSEVFDRIDVEQATREDLEGTFIQAYDSGDPGRHVTCFLGLCKLAGISTKADARKREGGGPSKTTRNKPVAPKPKLPETTKSSSGRQGDRVDPTAPVTVSFNVEIPADWSEEQIRERYEVVRRATGEDGGAS